MVIRLGMFIYDGVTGRLSSCFVGFSNSKLPGSISAFCLGPLGRKFFIGDKMGLLSMYNAKTGEKLCQLVRPKTVKKIEEIDQANGLKKSYAINSIVFCEDQNLLFTFSCDGVARIYEIISDEYNCLSEMRGGHDNSEITAGVYSRETLSLYTGGMNGTIAIWRVECSRLGTILRHSDSPITDIVDLYPYPCLLSSNGAGFIHCWRTRETTQHSPLVFQISIGQLLHKVGLQFSTKLGVRGLISVTTSKQIWNVQTRYVDPSKIEEEQNRRSPLVTDGAEWMSYDSIKKSLAEKVYGGIHEWELEGRKPPNFKEEDEGEEQDDGCSSISSEDAKNKTAIQIHLAFPKKEEITDKLKTRADLNIERLRSKMGDDFKVRGEEVIVENFTTGAIDILNIMSKPSPPISASLTSVENLSQNQDPPDAPTSKDEPEEEGSNKGQLYLDAGILYVYACSKGSQIYALPIEYLLKEHGIDRMNTKDYNRKRHEYFRTGMQRKDVIRGDKVYHTYLKAGQRSLANFPPAHVYLDSLICCNSWLSHRDVLVSCTGIENTLEGILTCARDCQVRVWSLNGDLWAEVNLHTHINPVWRLPFDFLIPIVNELKEVIEILKGLDKVQLTLEQEQKLITKFLFDNYVKPEIQQQLTLKEKTVNKQKLVKEWEERNNETVVGNATKDTVV